MTSENYKRLEHVLAIASAYGLLDEGDVDQLTDEFEGSSASIADYLSMRTSLSDADMDFVECMASPDQVAPGYFVVDHIGRGGMGQVFLAHQSRMNRLVALKTVRLSGQSDLKQIRRFRREARILGKLQHPNIVMAYDCGETSRHLFLSMELVRGTSLEGYLKQGGRFDESTVWFLVRQMVSALTFANNCSVIHRDLKPANVLLSAPPVGMQHDPSCPWVKLTDFGLSVLLSTDGDREERITQEFAGVGTPAYAAPEQALGETVDCRADIYSLGMTVFHLATGAAPFQGESLKTILTKKLTGEPPDFSLMAEYCSPQSVELVRRMTRSTPGGRFADYGELVEELDRCGLGVDYRPIDQELFQQCLAELPNAEAAADSIPASLARFRGSSVSMPTPGDADLVTRAHITSEEFGAPEVPRRRKLVWPWGVVGLLVLIGAGSFLLLNSTASDYIDKAALPASVVVDRSVVCSGASFGDLLVLQGGWFNTRVKVVDRELDVISGSQGWLRSDATSWWKQKQPSQEQVAAPSWFRWSFEVVLTGEAVLDVHFNHGPSSSLDHRILRIENQATESWRVAVGRYNRGLMTAANHLKSRQVLNQNVVLEGPSEPNLIPKSQLEVLHIDLEYQNGKWFIVCRTAEEMTTTAFESTHRQPRLTLDLLAAGEGKCMLSMLKIEHLAEP